MDQQTNLIDIIAKYTPLLNTLILAGVGWMIAQVKSVTTHLSILDGRMGKVESEAANIKETTNQRHAENKNTLERLEDGLRERCRFPDCPPAQKMWGETERRKE